PSTGSGEQSPPAPTRQLALPRRARALAAPEPAPRWDGGRLGGVARAGRAALGVAGGDHAAGPGDPGGGAGGGTGHGGIPDVLHMTGAPLADQRQSQGAEAAAGAPAPAPAAGLAVEALVKRFIRRGPAAVDQVSFSAPVGTVTTLLGPSGSGKSTVLRLIAGLEQPDEGRVLIAGVDGTRV